MNIHVTHPRFERISRLYMKTTLPEFALLLDFAYTYAGPLARTQYA